jgi:hemoglobin
MCFHVTAGYAVSLKCNFLPGMKKDIETNADIRLLVDTFYSKIKRDEVIGHFFTTVVTVNWETHLPVMYRFWDNLVFHTGSYSGNPMAVHVALNKKCHMQRFHFERWLQLWNETTDELFEGEKAFQLKQKALSIATVMQIKMAEMPGE